MAGKGRRSDRDEPSVGRREFLVGSASLALAAGLGACSDDTTAKPADVRPDVSKDAGTEARPPDGSKPCPSPSPLIPPPSPARVVEVHDAKCVTGSTVDAVRVKAMLAAGLKSLAQATDVKQAWKTLIPDFAPSMRIGIKLNCLSSYVYSSLPFLQALTETLVQDLGADATRLVVWDRRGDELTRSKITETALKVKVLGTVASTTDATGPGYEAKELCVLTRGTRLSKILTTETDITINIPLLKTHTISGMTGSMKNTYGCIHNPGDFHGDLIHELPVIYRIDEIHKRMRLHITEALFAVIKGDTADPPDTVPGRLLLATDPVALDSRAIALANTLRGTLKPVDPAKLGWIDEALKLNLGTTARDDQLITI
jgi:hypothetical protein